MKQQYLWAKIAIVAALSAASSAAWAENCYFTGGHYNGSPDTNTLYLESYSDEDAEVVFDNTVANCLKSNVPDTGAIVIVRRDTPLKSNSTIVLPFAATVWDDCIDVYEIADFNDSAGTWMATATHIKNNAVGRGAPLLMITNMEDEECLDHTKIRFKTQGREFQATTSSNLEAKWLYNSVTHNTDFIFTGTLKYKKWSSEDIRGVYGYAAKNKGAVEGGQFVKIGSGAYLPPLRAYLQYRGQNDALYKKSSNNIDDFELPETIEVRLIDSDSTMSIGKLNPVTGEIQMDSRRFDLNGRAINAKPANHGVYVGKQKMVR